MIKTEVIDKIYYNESLVKLVLDRKNINFEPGQHFSISIDGIYLNREYSCYSSAYNYKSIEFLIRVIKNGTLTSLIDNLVKKNTKVTLHGPFGKFGLHTRHSNLRKLFISTGTGIAPFRSIILSSHISNFTILQGISSEKDIIEEKDFNDGEVIYCISKGSTKYFSGRVTKFITEELEKNFNLDNTAFYICGNGFMISEVNDLLLKKYNINGSRIVTEAFF